MKRICQLLIRLYQKLISPLTPPTCKYYPTCSAYAYQAYEKHGFFKGTILSGYRLLRCNPWSNGGVDKVPDEFHIFKRTAKKKQVDNKKTENK